MDEELTPSEKIDKQIKFYRPIQVFMYIAAFVGIILFSVLMIYSVTESRAQTKRIEKQTQILVDCTTPVGECYKSSNKRQSGAVALIAENSAKAAAAATICAKVPGNNTYEKVLACTIKEMSGNG